MVDGSIKIYHIWADTKKMIKCMGLKIKETEELQEEEEKIEILKSFCQWLQPADGGRRD